MSEEAQAIEQQQSAESAEQHVEPAFESEAKAQGWVPKDNFRGDEADWVDAETFVRRGREIMPILRKNNEKLLKELGEAKKAAEEAKTVAKEFREFQKQQFEKKSQELQLQLDQLKQAKREAITQGDGDRAIAIDDAMDELKEQRQTAKEELKQAEEQVKQVVTAPQAVDPVLNEWIERNPWFGPDAKMTAIANALGDTILRENPGLTGKQLLERVDQELAETMPEKFGKKRVPNPMQGTPSGTARPGVTSGKKSYDSLPAEAKAACDRFVKQGLMTKEQYIAEYDWN